LYLKQIEVSIKKWESYANLFIKTERGNGGRGEGAG
jgi:hypothetical protein